MDLLEEEKALQRVQSELQDVDKQLQNPTIQTLQTLRNDITKEKEKLYPLKT